MTIARRRGVPLAFTSPNGDADHDRQPTRDEAAQISSGFGAMSVFLRCPRLCQRSR